MLLALNCGNLYAQKPPTPLAGQPLIDSLLKELPKQKEDTNKVNLLTATSFAYYSINPDEGIKYGQQALALATKLEWKKGIGNANNRLGTNYSTKSDYPKALEYFQEALKMFEEIGFKKGIASVSGNIGNIYYYQSDYSKALEYYFKALKMDEEMGNKNLIALITRNIGNVYYRQSDFPKALECYFKTLKMDEEIGNKNSVAAVTGNIGIIYYDQGDYPKALEYEFKALKMDEEIGDKDLIATVTGNIAGAYSQQSDYPKALGYYFKALQMDEEIGDKSGIVIVATGIGIAYAGQKKYTMAINYELKGLKIAEEMGDKHNAAHQLCAIGYAYLSLVTDTVKAGIALSGEMPEGKYLPAGQAGQPDVTLPTGRAGRLHKAIDYLQQGLAISKEINAPDVMQHCYQYLAEAYKLSGDYKMALEAADNYHAIIDSVFSKENGEKIIKMGMKNEYDRQHLTDSLKTDAKEKITALQLQRQRSYTTMGIAGILLLVGFSFFIVKERGKSERERKKSDGLLLNILPSEVAAELKTTGATTARHFDNVTVLFTDFVNFTEAGERMKPQALIDELHTCFKAFDDITTKYGVEKIKTIGDAYLAVCRLPTADLKHAENVVRAAIEINAFMKDRVAKLGNSTFEIRIGIHSGSVVAGIVGVKKFAYDIWGDTVNTAARMEQNSEAGKINISRTTYELVKDKFACEYRGEIDAKGNGMLKMYYAS